MWLLTHWSQSNKKIKHTVLELIDASEDKVMKTWKWGKIFCYLSKEGYSDKINSCGIELQALLVYKVFSNVKKCVMDLD